MGGREPAFLGCRRRCAPADRHAVPAASDAPALCDAGSMPSMLARTANVVPVDREAPPVVEEGAAPCIDDTHRGGASRAVMAVDGYGRGMGGVSRRGKSPSNP